MPYPSGDTKNGTNTNLIQLRRAASVCGLFQWTGQFPCRGCDEIFGSWLSVVRFFWNQRRPKLRERLANLIDFIMRGIFCNAGIAFWVSFVWSCPFVLEWFCRAQSRRQMVWRCLGTHDIAGGCNDRRGGTLWIIDLTAPVILAHAVSRQVFGFRYFFRAHSFLKQWQ